MADPDAHDLDTHVVVIQRTIGWTVQVRMRRFNGEDWPVISRRRYLFGANAMHRAHSWMPMDLTVIPRSTRLR